MRRHGALFLQRLAEGRDVIAAEFDAIDAMGFLRTFAECLDQARDILQPLLSKPNTPRRRR